MAWVSDDDGALPSETDGINVVLNRIRLARFLVCFAEDKDVRDLLALDVLGSAVGLPLSSTGLLEDSAVLATRPFRLWEYAWLYKSLRLNQGGRKVLDLGGPASHLSVLAAIAECDVTSVDINPVFVQAGNACAEILHLNSLRARLGDMRDLSSFPDESFDTVVSCSVLEHLTADDQRTALREMARVLKPGGVVGLTFDFGIPAPGANEHLPPPHDPPQSAADALCRYVQAGLAAIGNPFSEEPIPGSLFRHHSVSYTVASLFLAKPPVPTMGIPQPERTGSVLQKLVIQDLPYRIHKSVTSRAALVNELRIASQAQGEIGESSQARVLERAEAAVREHRRRSAALEQVAADRLAAMNEKDQAMAQLSGELDRRDLALQEARNQLACAVETINEQHRRSVALEETAAERLAAMNEKDQAMAQLSGELGRRDIALQEARDQLVHAVETVNQQHLRAVGLEQAAAERLAAMNEKDQVIAALRGEFDLQTALQRQWASDIKRLVAENDVLQARIRTLEHESSLDYVRRRLKRPPAIAPLENRRSGAS